MSKLGITKGEWEFKPEKAGNGWTAVNVKNTNHDVATCYTGTSKDDLNELEANAKLIADAGTTANKCEMLPSELLEQRDEFLKVLKNAEFDFKLLGIRPDAPMRKNIIDLIQSIENA